MINDVLHYAWHRSLRDTGLRACTNRLRFGQNAPRPNEKLWIKPALITHRYRRPNRTEQQLSSRYSGSVINGDWDLAIRKLWFSKKYRACRQHFKNGVSWEDTGIYDYSMRRIARDGQIDGLKTIDQVKDRYATLDKIMDTIKAEGKLREADPSPNTERNGILVHIDRNGKALFGNEGYHRIALARLAKLPIVPVRLGIIHRDALETGALANLRIKPVA